MLVVSHVHKMDSGANSPILKNISFTVTAGQRVVLVGEGKSTLLDIIAGNTKPDKGTVRLKPVSLSIGYLNRDNPKLETLLADNPQILIIDDPTGYLEGASLEALVTYLNDFPGGVVIVSEDVALLDRMVTHIVEINPDTARARVFACRYSDYLATVTDDTGDSDELHHDGKPKPKSASRSQQRQARRAEFESRARVNRLNRVNPNR